MRCLFIHLILTQNIILKYQVKIGKVRNMDVVKKIKNYTYNERHCLGEGSFGKVYQGRSDQGMQVAIKKVQQRMISKDPYLRSSLQSEINIMKKLNHKNIVKLHDLVMTSNSIYLIMEFCAGGDLKRYCRNRKLSEDEATMILKQICQGFQQIVKKGIIHRDLKPANILVHQGIFKICDFGFAKFFGDTSRMAKTCVGTPIYMSPQVLHQQSYTNKTDIWSLGALYYELMFGKLPFHGISEEQLYRNILKGPLIIPNCTKNTYNLIKGMLEVDQNKRFQWNKLFQLFELGQISELPIANQPKKQQGRNGFYRQKSINEQRPQNNEYRQRNNVPMNKMANFQGIRAEIQPQHNNFLRQEFARDNQRSREKDNENIKMSVGPHQRKPKNPLAFQNVPPPTNQNNNLPTNNGANGVNNKGINGREDIPISQQKIQLKNNQSEENPRFFYFVLIELIVNPLTNCQSYSNLVSALYYKTTDLYKNIAEKEGNSVYKKILMSELQELKAIEQEIPQFVDEDYKKMAQAVIREIRQSGGDSGVWVQRLLNKNYTYK